MKYNLRKFDAKAYKGIFIGYFTSSKSFRVFDKRTLTIEQLVHVTFDEYNSKLVEVEVVDCASIMKMTNLEENDQELDQGQRENQE